MASHGDVGLEGLQYIINHVFMPLQLPQQSDHSVLNDSALVSQTYKTANSFTPYITHDTHRHAWDRVVEMLKHLETSCSTEFLSREIILEQLRSMSPGDIRVFLIRRQNAAVLIRNEHNDMIVESWEASPISEAVIAAAGKLLWSFPGPAISIPRSVADDDAFLVELANFLHKMDVEEFADAIPHTEKAGSSVRETRETTDPRYITELLTSILHGAGERAEVPQISKRIGDDVLWQDAELPWRRTPLWLVIRVSLQTTLVRITDGHITYKSFILFLLASTLDQVRQKHFSSFSDDIIFCMSAKMSRRLLKLGSAASPAVTELTVSVAKDIRTALEERHASLRPKPLPPIDLTEDDFERDTNLTLPNSRAYIEQALSPSQQADLPTPFTPSHRSRKCRFPEFVGSLSTTLSNVDDDEKLVVLTDFEAAVHDFAAVEGWRVNTRDADASVQLKDCMSEYFSVAKSRYAGDPECMSTMYLTLLLLWVTLDCLVVDELPLLSDFRPEIETKLFEPLVLRTECMRKLLTIALSHITERHARAISRPVLEGSLDHASFPIRYFNTSSTLQALKHRIENDAEAAEREKRDELREKVQKYRDLTNSAHRETHAEQHWRYYCRRCNLEKEAENISISIYERPLPSNETQAKSAVFEIACPTSFSAWRDATYHLLSDVFNPSASSENSGRWYGFLDPFHSSRYQPLCHYAKAPLNSCRRVTMGSTTKSFLQTHYKNGYLALHGFPGTSDVIVNNGLRFELLDTSMDVPTASRIVSLALTNSCTYPLPQGLYSNLAYSLRGTTHSSNEVVAKQSECHKELSIHEYCEYGSIRSGERLQWMNILRVLRSRALNFRQEEVYTLGVQAALQVGPYVEAQMPYPWHIILQNNTFCHALIKELDQLLKSIEDNWLELFTARFIIDILLRIISSYAGQNIFREAIATLRYARVVVFKWLDEELSQAPDRSTSLESQSRIRDAAAVCLTTFDTEAQHIASLLSCSEDLKIYVQSSIILHDYTPGSLKGIPGHSKRLLTRVRRFTVFLEPYIYEQTKADRTGLDDAIYAIWENYRADKHLHWARLDAPNSRWMTCATAQTKDQASQAIHYNLLDGSLLVDGQSLGRLPTTITRHPVYCQLFAEQILEVVPSDLRGMKYATRDTMEKHQIFFALIDNEPVIKIKRIEDNAIFQLIPSPKLRNDLPLPFVNDHIHWLNISSCILEIRPSHRKWSAVYDRDWRIHISTLGPTTMTRRTASNNTTSLVDLFSPTCRALSEYLNAIELPAYQIVSYTAKFKPALQAELARSGFVFFIDAENKLESRELSGFVIDNDQFSGTMLGLQNQLVLRPMDSGASGEMRRVIIPRGTVSYSSSTRTRISIENPQRITRLSYDIYKVDTDLGRLKLNGFANTTSYFFKAYLHALSSLCLPDSLTQRTGTEEALRELRSASCLSFSALKDEDVTLLCQISELTPRRQYYPQHLRRMQSVSWSTLSPLAQHEEFFHAVGSILAHAMRVHSLNNTQVPPQAGKIESFDDHLYRRACLRRLPLQGDGYAKVHCDTRDADIPYSSRACVIRRDLGQRLSSISAAVLRWSYDVLTLPTRDLFYTLQSISSDTSLAGKDSNVTSLSYDALWLVPPHQIWTTAFELCRKPLNKYQLVFTLTSMAYCDQYKNRQELLMTLLCLARLSETCLLPIIPSHPSFVLDDGVNLDQGRMERIISRHCRPFSETPEASWSRSRNETDAACDRRKHEAYSNTTSQLKSSLLDVFVMHWKRGESPLHPAGSFSIYFYMENLLRDVRDLFCSWRRNQELQAHSNDVQAKLDQISWNTYLKSAFSVFPPVKRRDDGLATGISYDDLYSRKPRKLWLPNLLLPQHFSHDSINTNSFTDVCLGSLLARIRQQRRGPPFDAYTDGLESSRLALESHSTRQWDVDEPDLYDMAQEDLHQCQQRFAASCHALVQSLRPVTPHEQALSYSGLWPNVSVIPLLQNLALPGHRSLPAEWSASLQDFARIIIALQTSRRRALMTKHGQYNDLLRDLEHTKDGRCMTVCPDWLLIQIDADFTLRDVQYQVAHQMLSEGSNQSITLQLNMGEGKSSVIAPLVASSVADGVKLARMIVLKTLAPQMAQTMHDRLTGLTNRRLYFLPFSRSTDLDMTTLRYIEEIVKECSMKGGILIIQPEQILSLKLRSVECQLSADDTLSRSLTRTQKFLFQNARDILDESDEILHVRYQLVYTAGDHQRLQGHPHRWTTTQELLRLVRNHLRRLFTQFPSAFSVQGLTADNEHEASAFPSLRLLDSPSDAAREFQRLIVSDIMRNRLPACNFVHFDEEDKNVLQRFISSRQISENDERLLLDMRTRGVVDDLFWNSMLLLRGLIGFGVLTFALSDKRYRVDYGLDPQRSMLAVPYRAKDVPSTNAEFGHPDVVVLLTCLSYYFAGLSDPQLDTCVRFLGSLDNPESAYEKWTSLVDGSVLPQSLWSFKGLNFESAEQRRVICSIFRYNQATIDFYLRAVVFPQEAKEFESRLACSAWDIVEPKVNITTGFSGTNDFRHLLPTYTIQQDPDHQLSTNARVLSYLLRGENNYYETFPFPNGLRFVEMLAGQNPKVRMLLDVGAQMLDVKNRDLAQHWLRCESEQTTMAAIYVDDKDELTVLHRDGHDEPLSASHVNQHLGQCIVYLDDAHTRGVDIKLPEGFRAAVTLGPRVTKDRLAQGCMRMRRLGAGHTICFFAPPDIDRNIRRVAEKAEGTQITVEDVLLWAITETCHELKTRALQWAHQGIDHHARYDTWSHFLDAETPGQPVIDHLRTTWLQQEARTLEEMYGIHANTPTNTLQTIASSPVIYDRCLQLGLTPSTPEHAARLDEEQEREVAHEIEREEQVERPPPKSPAKHQLHQDVIAFVTTGHLRPGSSAFVKAFSLFSSTQAELPDAWSGDLWATRDFATTVVSNIREKEFFRPVHWVLSNVGFMTETNVAFIILSPYEVNALLPSITQSTKVHLHVFTPRLTQEIQPCDDFSLFNIPSLQPLNYVLPEIRMQLALFSGQLYLENSDAYLQLCKFLGVVAEDIADQHIKALPDGFVQPSQRPPGIRSETPFTRTPILALAELMNIRRKGMSFDETHIGKIINARPVSQQDFRENGST
ncbi:hypothetical protein CONPUDRAFT_130199 [Coniophora puteana RWD-64-598 SS2]|uniref:ubiquitinyl hydrolase 1 n=1 Tax=Coniophora puteana (strain RWD-64-598) TaxID=741705 RepID=A0A5M3MCY1_CONPW|nr:uncharacterized protein CONPUDRAFT_130199 [Coniophora puteana RWD-64-598 SS2]EIW76857.1 hypothetical protein CONPUDRAFT_130199 [Coniophora puteana RWD-64-598 SS2]